MRTLTVFLTVAIVLSPAAVARADDAGPFHRTTPRAALETQGGALVIGVPGGRAWGIESELRLLPPPDTVLFVRLAVTDEGVREAFVRVAYYASASGRTRQLAVSDSETVPAHGRSLVAVALDPPAGAVAYRVRVLARLTDRSGRSTADAVVAVIGRPRAAASPGGSLSRLLP